MATKSPPKKENRLANSPILWGGDGHVHCYRGEELIVLDAPKPKKKTLSRK